MANNSFESFYSKERNKSGGGRENIGLVPTVTLALSPLPDILSLPFPREMAPPSKKLLVSPWQIFNSTAAWKNRILPMVGDTTSPIPHPAISATLRRGEGGGSALRGHLDTRSWEILFRPRS